MLQVRTQDLMPDAIGETIVKVLREQETELRDGAIITVEDGGLRVRILPLQPGPV